MDTTKTIFQFLYRILPVIGVLLFVTMYFISTNHYSGGSLINTNSEGFDWRYNYLCHLFDYHSINGERNPARPIAIYGLLIFCFSTGLLFFQFSQSVYAKKPWKTIISTCGVSGMLSTSLIFTAFHDLMTALGSILTGIALIGIIINMNNLKTHKLIAGFCTLLIISNNFVYYTNYYISWLPALQKLSCVAFLFWMIWINIKLLKSPFSYKNSTG